LGLSDPPISALDAHITVLPFCLKAHVAMQVLVAIG